MRQVNIKNIKICLLLVCNYVTVCLQSEVIRLALKRNRRKAHADEFQRITAEVTDGQTIAFIDSCQLDIYVCKILKQ